jgi:hypothetical protein
MSRVVIGVDPHKRTATIEIINDREQAVGQGNPAASARACNEARICAQTPSRCHRRNHRYSVCHGGYTSGTSRHGDPVRTRHRIASITTRRSRGGRPIRTGGSTASSLAH